MFFLVLFCTNQTWGDWATSTYQHIGRICDFKNRSLSSLLQNRRHSFPPGDGGGREQSGSIDKSVDRELYWRSKLSPSVSHSSPRYAPDKRWVTGADATLSRCHLSHPALPFFSWYTQSLTLVWSRRAVLYLICDPNRQSPTPTVTLYGDPLWRRWPRVTQRPGENDTGCLDVRFSRTDIIRENISPAQHRCYLGKPI